MKTYIPTSPFRRPAPVTPLPAPKLTAMSVCRVSRKGLPRCLPGIMAAMLLSSCAREFRNAQGVIVARLPDDGTKCSFSYADAAGTRINWTADRSMLSTVARANWKGLERTLGTVGPMLRPEAAVGTIVPLLGREGL